MNEIETKTPDKPYAPETESPQQQIAALQRQVAILTLALLVVSGTYCTYVGLQARRARYDLTSLKAAAEPVRQEFQQQKPQWDAFVSKVAEYGKTHPDFAPIINKYKIIATEAPGATNAPRPAQPAQPAQPKK